MTIPQHQSTAAVKARRRASRGELFRPPLIEAYGKHDVPSSDVVGLELGGYGVGLQVFEVEMWLRFAHRWARRTNKAIVHAMDAAGVREMLRDHFAGGGVLEIELRKCVRREW